MPLQWFPIECETDFVVSRCQYRIFSARKTCAPQLTRTERGALWTATDSPFQWFLSPRAAVPMDRKSFRTRARNGMRNGFAPMSLRCSLLRDPSLRHTPPLLRPLLPGCAPHPQRLAQVSAQFHRSPASNLKPRRSRQIRSRYAFSAGFFLRSTSAAPNVFPRRTWSHTTGRAELPIPIKWATSAPLDSFFSQRNAGRRAR